MIKQANKHLVSLHIAVEVMRSQRALAVSKEGVLLDMLSNINSRAKNFFASIFDIKVGSVALVHAKALFSSNPDTFKHLTVKDFVALSRTKVQTMEGFAGNYVEYANAIMSVFGNIDGAMSSQVLDNELKHYKTLLARVVSNKDDQNSWEDLTTHYSATASLRKDLDKTMEAFWRPGSFETVTTIGALVGNMQELNALLYTPGCYAERIKSALNAISIQSYKDRVSEIGELTKIFDERVKQGKLSAISSVQINNLSEGIHELALQVEQFAVTLYRAHSFVTALGNLDKAVESYK